MESDKRENNNLPENEIRVSFKTDVIRAVERATKAFETFETVKFSAINSGMSRLILIVEITKIKLEGLHQINFIETLTKEGNESEGQRQRFLTAFKIELSKTKPKNIPTGYIYQAPYTKEHVEAIRNVKVEERDEEDRPRRGGRGGYRGGRGGRGGRFNKGEEGGNFRGGRGRGGLRGERREGEEGNFRGGRGGRGGFRGERKEGEEGNFRGGRGRGGLRGERREGEEGNFRGGRGGFRGERREGDEGFRGGRGGRGRGEGRGRGRGFEGRGRGGHNVEPTQTRTTIPGLGPVKNPPTKK
jgi:hypothetical protein